jgi:GT2 family glycosyltransferase
MFGYPRSASALASWVAAPRLVSGVFQRWRGLQSLLARRDAGSARLQPIVGEDFPAGAALLVRKEAWEEAGGFDETFFMYSEETDLCLRLRRLGWRIVLCPTSVFVHLGGASTAGVSGEMEREQLRSYLRFFAKHRGFAEAERSRRLVARALRVRALAVRGDERVEQRELAAWLGDTTLEALLR